MRDRLPLGSSEFSDEPSRWPESAVLASVGVFDPFVEGITANGHDSQPPGDPHGAEGGWPSCGKVLAMPPNGLELSCPAGQAAILRLYGTIEGRASRSFRPARRVSFSELLGGVAGLRPPVLGQQLPRVACVHYPQR